MASWKKRRSGWLRTRLRATAALAAVSMVGTVVSVSAASAVNTDRAAKIWQPGGIQAPATVPGHNGTPAGAAARATGRTAAGVKPIPVKSAAVQWPTGWATVSVLPPDAHAVSAATKAESTASESLRATGNAVQASGLPVAIAPAGPAGATGAQVKVVFASQSEAHAAGIQGTVFTVARADAGAGATAAVVSLDYAGFASAFGGGYADRLKLVALPACALTTPQMAACRVQSPVVFTNDLKAQTVSASVSIPPASGAAVPGRSVATPDSRATAQTAMVLAATASASGGVGS